MKKYTNFKVIKRDGRIVNFDKNKIFIALNKAYNNLKNINNIQKKNNIKYLMKKINIEIYKRFKKNIKIYEIQNIIEHILLKKNKYNNLAKKYINYRIKKDIERNKLTDINIAIKNLIKRNKYIINENANKDSNTFTTQRDLTAGIVSKTIGLRMLPKHVVNAHNKGLIHYHDLDYNPYNPMTNCCLIDFENMLNNGFKIGNAFIETPNSIQTATAQIAQIIANVSSSQYGGCSADRIDELLKKFAYLNYKKHIKTASFFTKNINKQKKFANLKTKKDIYDAMQSLEYEINTLFTSNGQTPFTSIGFGLGTSWIEREIQKAILNIRINGLGKDKKTAIFPKLIFTIKKGINFYKNDINYDIKLLALKCSVKRMYPDILNYDKIIELTGNFKIPMGCRSFLQKWIDVKTNKEINNGRMNLGVVTINLPSIALETKNKFSNFWILLKDRLKIIKDALLYKIQRCKESIPENAPILYMHGAFGKKLKKNDIVNNLFKNKRATVSLGYIGLYETATVFFGDNWEKNIQAKKFTINILKTLKNFTILLTKKYNYYFSVYSTPSESLTDKFCRLDKKRFGIIKNITDKDYYTNSFHYDIRKSPTPFEKINFEKDYPIFCSGGFIHYCEYPILKHNLKALETVWDYSYNKIGYLGTNIPIDHCYKCNFDGDFKPTSNGFECPICKNNNPEFCDVVKRTCGYLGNPQIRPMVFGRHKEIISRKKNNI